MHDRIKIVRTSSVGADGKKLTQDKFAVELGVSKNYICQLETGSRDASDSLIKLICVKYGINENWLRNGTGEMRRSLSDDEEIAEWVGRIQFGALSGVKADVIRKKILVAAMHIKDDEVWETLYNVLQEITTE